MANKVYEVPADWAKAADLIGGGFTYDTSKKYDELAEKVRAVRLTVAKELSDV